MSTVDALARHHYTTSSLAAVSGYSVQQVRKLEYVGVSCTG
jgi:hypothetical protein